MLILAFDYGSKNIGLAVGDASGISVRPLGTLRATKGLPAKAQVQQYIIRYQPSQLVVGLPLAGGENLVPSRMGAEKLAMWLRKHFALPVAMCDESHSSVVSPKKDRDAHAACVILREWIDCHARQ